MQYSSSIKINNMNVITRFFGVIGLITLIGGISMAEPIVIILGGIFFAIGAIAEFIRIRRVKQIATLKAQGITLEAQYQGVELNDNLEVNGRNPFRIVCQWLDPQTNQVHLFYSENLWYNPEPYINQTIFKVLVQPSNFKIHYIDTSFLPKLAN